MKHVTGLANSAGTRGTAIALSTVQSRRLGVIATEQTKIIAVITVSSSSDFDSISPALSGMITKFSKAQC
jgi:hypothetical protein